jgi:hypothetical protein
MNEQYEISLHEFRQYPKISEKTIASTKIFVIGYFIGIFIIAAGVHWGNKYPSSTQRGQRPQPAHYRPLLVGPFEFYSGPLSTDKDAELYAAAYVDDYAFKTHLFTSRGTF